jgi:nickel-dependent lactate racemase
MLDRGENEVTSVNMKVDEHYDRTIQINFPKTWDVSVVRMAGHSAPALTDEQIRDALNHPIGSPTIQELAKGKTGKIVVTCDDLERPTPAYRVFPFVMEELNKAGISDSQIFIMGAYGLHAAMTADSYGRKVGWDMVRRFDCVNHNAFKNHQNLGKTSRGTPLLVDSEFAKADLRIVVCGIKKHPSAGTGGAGKHVVPGVASFDTIAYNHQVIGRTADRGIWKIKGNAIREDMQEAGRMADVDIVVNCCYNDNRDVVGLFVGDLDDAWHEAVKYSYDLHSTKVGNKKADVVVVNSYLQAQQGIDWWPASSTLGEGGTAVGIHLYTPGWRLTHYSVESFGSGSDGYWARMEGYPRRLWPVKQAGKVMVWSEKIAKRNMLRLSEKVEWIPEWQRIVKQLEAVHGENASAMVFPCSRVQFDPSKAPLVL